MTTEPLRVELFITGCPTCDGAREAVAGALAPFGQRVILEVHDLGADRAVPTRYGLLATPAVVVGGKVAVESCTPERVARAVEKQLQG
jgi:hypothetical protein